MTMETDNKPTPDTGEKALVPAPANDAPEPAETDTAATEPQPADAPPAETSQIAATDLLELIRAAEERGYRKGIDEAARKNISATNGLWSAPETRRHEDDYDTSTEILKTIRPGVWDM